VARYRVLEAVLGRKWVVWCRTLQRRKTANAMLSYAGGVLSKPPLRTTNVTIMPKPFRSGRTNNVIITVEGHGKVLVVARKTLITEQ